MLIHIFIFSDKAFWRKSSPNLSVYKIPEKLKNPHYLRNSEFYQKSALNKKYLKLNFLSEMLNKI